MTKEPVSVHTQPGHRLDRARDRLAGDMEDAVDVEQNGGHAGGVYSGDALGRAPARRGGASLLALERARRTTRQHGRDAGRGGAGRRIHHGADGAPETARAREGGQKARAVAQDERSQSRNRELAVQRLVEQLREALKVERRRVPTKPTAIRASAAGSEEAALEDEEAPSRARRVAGLRAGSIGSEWWTCPQVPRGVISTLASASRSSSCAESRTASASRATRRGVEDAVAWGVRSVITVDPGWRTTSAHVVELSERDARGTARGGRKRRGE